MNKYIEGFIKWFIIIFLLGMMAFYLSKCNIVQTNVYGTVKDKATTSDRYGSIEYYTIVESDDGTLHSKSGLKYYATPVGGRVSWIEESIKFR